MFKQVKYIDLFAGIGGFHQAMNSFNAECVFASEWDKDATKTYFDNYGIYPNGDITKIKEENIRPESLIKEYKKLFKDDLSRFLKDKHTFIIVNCPACNSKHYKSAFVP